VGEPSEEPFAALENSEEMIEDNPRNPDALRLLGRAASALGWRETTIYAYESLHEVAPRDVETLVRLGEALLVVGRANDAAAAARRALRIDGTSDRALAVLRSASMAQPARSA
jgi:cytochrome c-type biogenesis protein CcmH/NrfG